MAWATTSRGVRPRLGSIRIRELSGAIARRSIRPPNPFPLPADHHPFIGDDRRLCGERRIDVVEFVTIVRAIGADPVKLLRDLISGKTPAKPRRAASK